MNKFRLFINQNEKSLEIGREIKKKLLNKNFIESEDEYEISIALGGDGSFLRMIKETNFRENCIYVGINTGTLGFAQEINIDEINSFIEDLEKEDYKIETIGIEEIEIKTPDSISKQLSLNEVVIRDLNLNTTNLEIKVEDNLLEHYVGDGILISTSFGSTAYNLSFGGSIVYNTFHTLQITPIAPLNNKSYRNLLNSVIIPSNKEIKITPENRTKDLLITIDGDNNEYNNVEEIKIKIEDRRIQVYRKKDYNFIKKINNKFLK